MGFSQSSIVAVNKPRYRGSMVYYSWISSAAPGTWYQVYIDRQLAWFGQRTWVWLPAPTAVGRVDVGAVNAGEERTLFTWSLPAAPQRSIELTWLGGTFQAADIAGFYVYGESSPGAGIIYATPLATIVAYPGGFVTDGYGLGGFGTGGFGESPSSYSWTSPPLLSGTWHFAVIPFDGAGNEGTAVLTYQTVVGPPLAPAPSADGTRLHYSYSSSTHQATLAWNASPN